jgi:hypothetical protein
MRVGSLTKTAKVLGDRTWSKGLLGTTPSPAKPFTVMPLLFERAWGGPLPVGDSLPSDWDRRNPVGTGFAPSGTNPDGMPLPNVEDPKHTVGSPRDRVKPTGFGPIGREWEPRAKYGGTYDDKWMKERHPLLPNDFDETFFQCAPEDQQAPELLRGGEEVELENLTREGALRFNLPKVFLAFETDLGGSPVEHRATLHTVVLETDIPRVVLVYQTSVECQGREDRLRGTTIRQKALIPLGDSHP